MGAIRIEPLGRDQLHISTVQNEPGSRPLLIHRVPYHLSLHLARTDGTWHEAQSTHLYLRRPDVPYNASFPSPAALTAVREQLIPAVIGWANAHPRDLEIAEGIRLAQLLADKDQDLTTAEAASPRFALSVSACAPGSRPSTGSSASISPPLLRA